MEIENLLDLKKSLEKVPDELLKNTQFGCGEGAEETIGMCHLGGDGEYEYPQVLDILDKEFPQYNEVQRFFENFAKAQEILDEQEERAEKLQEKLMEGEPLTSEKDFFKFLDEDEKSPHNIR